MRFGLLGPAEGDVVRLERAAEFLLGSVAVTRAVYLGADQALDTAVSRWATRLVGGDPSDGAVWGRAAHVAISGSTEDIDRFVQNERARLRLRALACLPAGPLRTMEMVGDRVAVLTYDKAMLDEEDIFAAGLLIYGKSDTPLVKRIGTRWFVTPGSLSDRGGVAVLDDGGEDIVMTLYDRSGNAHWAEPLNMQRIAKVRIQGGP